MSLKILCIALGTVAAAIAVLTSRAKATPAELLTLEVECVGGSLNACPLSSELIFSGDYTTDDIPIEDRIHIFQFSSERAANIDENGTLINTGLTVGGHYNISGTAPPTAGKCYYKAYNNDQSNLVTI